MHVKWHGHSCFEFSNDDLDIVIDPHDGKSIGIRPPNATADIVLITHKHYDHNAVRVINGDHTDHISHNGTFECKGMSFRGFPTFHDNENGTVRGQNTMYMFQMDGISVCHCGDLGQMPSREILREIQGVDLLFLPVGGIYTMENDALKKFISEVNPRIIIPMHYRTGGLTIPIASVDGFLEMIPKDFTVYIGNSIEINTEELPELKECWVFERQ